MSDRKVKPIGWIIETRPGLTYPWNVKKSTFSNKSKEDCLARFKYRDKDWDLANGYARCIPVYVEDQPNEA